MRGPRVHAGADLVKGILTNLLENAADAAGRRVGPLTITRLPGRPGGRRSARLGPGISEEASRTLFEPTITFKKHGMGLGSVDRRKERAAAGWRHHAGEGELGGAGFRVTLPAAQTPSCTA